MLVEVSHTYASGGSRDLAREFSGGVLESSLLALVPEHRYPTRNLIDTLDANLPRKVP
jgi:hypothetical protein